GALAVAVLGHGQHRASLVHDLHRDHFVVVAQRDAADAVGAAAHRADVGVVAAHGEAVARPDQDLLGAVGHFDGDHRVPFLDAHRDEAARARIAEGREIGLLDGPLAGANPDELPAFLLRELLHRQERRDLLLGGLELDEIDDRLALAAGADVGDFMDLEPLGAAGVGEDHDVGVRRGDEELADVVLFARAHADAPLAAAALGAVGRDRHALDVAGVGDRDRHVLGGYRVIDAQPAALVDDLGAGRVAELLADGLQLVDHELRQQLLAGEDRAQAPGRLYHTETLSE